MCGSCTDTGFRGLMHGERLRTSPRLQRKCETKMGSMKYMAVDGNDGKSGTWDYTANIYGRSCLGLKGVSD